MAVVEFLLSQSCKHQTSEKVFSKDLLQMGMAIENANAIVKAFVDQGEHIHRVQKSFGNGRPQHVQCVVVVFSHRHHVSEYVTSHQGSDAAM